MRSKLSSPRSIVYLLSFVIPFITFSSLASASNDKEQLFMRLPSSFWAQGDGVVVGNTTSRKFKVQSSEVPELEGELLKFAFGHKELQPIETLVAASNAKLTRDCIKPSTLKAIQPQGDLVKLIESTCTLKNATDNKLTKQYLITGAYQGELSVFVLVYSWVLTDEYARDNTVQKIKEEMLEYLENTRLCGGSQKSCEQAREQFLYDQIKKQAVAR